MNSKDVIGSGRGLVLSTVPIFLENEVNNENPQQDNPCPEPETFQTWSGRGLVLSTVPIFLENEVNDENPQQDNPCPDLNPKPSKHEEVVV